MDSLSSFRNFFGDLKTDVNKDILNYNTTAMKTILENNSGHLSVDYEKGMLICAFVGDVQFDDYKALLLTSAEEVRSNGVRNIIMDRSQIERIDGQCRVWVKSIYLKTHIKPLVPKLNKVAAVNSASIVGMIYGKAIYQTFSLFYPTMEFKFFPSMEKAMKWFRESEEKGTLMVEDVLAMDAENSSPELVEADATGNEQIKKGLFNKLFDALFSK